jgi:hypothetical protein
MVDTLRGAKLLVLVLGAALAACSAIVEPDVGRLGGGTDGGRVDAGLDAGRDGGPRDAGTDGGPVCPASCDDAIACTVDSCVGGVCTHAPDDAACGPDQRCSPMLGCVAARCTEDEECDDGLFCNGEERCDPGAPGSGCVAGEAPTCDDGASCTSDRCDETNDECAFEPNDGACADAFACTVDACDPDATDDPSGCVRRADDSLCASDFCTTGGRCSATSGCIGGMPRDCRDGNVCTSDSCDSAGRRCVSTPVDADGDGAPARSVGGTSCAGGTDCNDGDPTVSPAAMETCGNGRDDNCDGRTDEGCPATVPDDCASAGTITLATEGSDRVGSARGSIASFRSDYQTNAVCSAGSGARDAVYVIEVPSGTWDVTIDTIGSTFDTVLGVGVGRRDACSATLLQTVCNDDYASPSVSTASRVWVHRLNSPSFSSTYLFVLVDAFSSSTATGDFVVNVRLSPARADQCPTASSTPFDISGGGTVLGFQTGFAGSQRGSCQGDIDFGGEAVFFVRGASSGSAEFTVYSTDFNPAIYLRARPCASGTELDCRLGSGIGGGVNRATLAASVTTGEAYFFFVDGGRGTYAVYFDPT